MPIITHNTHETKQLAAKWLKMWQGGDVIGLEGELGTGKTTFVQGVGEALKINQPITSPTFLTMQIYPVVNLPKNKSAPIKFLCHIDAYRITNETDSVTAGLSDYLGKKDTLCLVEWPENIKFLSGYNKIIFKHKNKYQRIIDYKESK